MMKYNNSEVFYCVHGEGDIPIVMLNGWGCDYTIYEALLNTFPYVIFIDFPPFGKSENLKEIWTMYDYKNLILQILKKLKIDKANFVCHSFGARVGILIASETKIAKSLTIISGAGLKNQSFKCKYKIFKYKLKKSLHFRCMNCGSDDYKKLDEVGKATFKNIVNLDLKNELPKINCPTLLIYGEKDTQTPVKIAKIFHKKIKNSKLYIIKSCGHFCFLEKPICIKKILQDFYEGEKL